MDLWTVRKIWKKSITITIIRGADVPKNVTPCDQGMWKLERKNQVKQRLMATRQWHVWCITPWEVLMMWCINACSNQAKSHSLLGQKKNIQYNGAFTSHLFEKWTLYITKLNLKVIKIMKTFLLWLIFFGFSDTFAKSNNASEALVIRKGENI